MEGKIILPNGVRILTERVPGVRSAALGIWVRTGSRHETAEENGASHFIEHMVFKGTEHRSAQDLAEEMDALGGRINAYTNKESTCFHAHVLDEHLPRTIALLSDMLLFPKFADEDVNTERGVVLEEIGMCDDDPDDLCGERMLRAVFAGSSLGRPILGEEATLRQMNGAWLRAYMKRHYLPERVVVALAGSFRDEDVEDLKRRFSAMAPGEPLVEEPAVYHPAFTFKEKEGEQNHISIAFPSLTNKDPRRYALRVLNTTLGDGMSSRLWQEVREKRGLCYSIYSEFVEYEDTGIFGISTSLSPETEEEAIRTICRVVRDYVEGGVTQAELDRVRELNKANILMSLESTVSHMGRMSANELRHGQQKTVEELLAFYDAVTVEDVQALAREIFDFSRVSLSAVGHVRTEQEYRTFMGC